MEFPLVAYFVLLIMPYLAISSKVVKGASMNAPGWRAAISNNLPLRFWEEK